MYSKLSAGIMFIDDYEEGSKSTDYSPLFSFQAGAVCVQAGGQRVRGFVELGIGMVRSNDRPHSRRHQRRVLTEFPALTEFIALTWKNIFLTLQRL